MFTPKLLIGAAVLILGRKLYWLFVGAVGFLIGIALAPRFLAAQPDWVILVVALAAGLLGALLTLFLQQLAIGLAGFVGGGYVTIYLLSALGLDAGSFNWVAFLLGGIVGLVLIIGLFDWALIILSSLTGAALIVQTVPLRPLIAAILFVALAAVGIAIQAEWMRREST